jgi:hypothetical protein
MRLIAVFLVCFFSESSLARVRTVEMDSGGMKPITLAMGRSTVLQFTDKPKKIVSGNSNYFNIEFTGNDVTIQPLSQVASNLFIYSGNQRFGFLLRVCNCAVYDDLVKVYWKYPKKPRSSDQSLKRQFPKLSFRAGSSEVFVSNMFYHRFNDVYVVDGSFILPKGVKEPKSDDFWVTRAGKKLTVLDVIFSDETEFNKYRNFKFRLFLKLAQPVDFTLRARVDGKEGNTILRKIWYQ